jgi:Mrp family chromosome partitioning ATPase
MSALDQAFIKAYSQQGTAAPVLKPTTKAKPASKRRSVPLSQAMAEQPALPESAVWSAKVTLDELMAGIEKPEPTAADVRSTAFSRDLSEKPLEDNITNAATARSVANSWRPMLQVDGFQWPKSCDRLDAEAAGPLSQLADALAALAKQGQKVIGLASCSEGEGVTTLLLAVGRRLAKKGLRVVMADANLSDPQLAASLGLLPQVGWEETLAGRLPLAEVAIESLADNLTLLPVREPLDDSPPNQARLDSGLATLAANSDIVLVDLGCVESSPLVTPKTAGRAQLGAVVLVQNVRQTTPDRLANVQSRLAAAGVSIAGVVENFVVN